MERDELSPVGRRATGRRDWRRLERFAEVREDLPDRARIGDECDEPDVATTQIREPGEELKDDSAVVDPGAIVASDFTTCLEVVLEAFGAQRLMFGSDWPVCLLAAEYAEVAAIAGELFAELPQVEQDAVWGATQDASMGWSEPRESEAPTIIHARSFPHAVASARTAQVVPVHRHSRAIVARGR